MVCNNYRGVMILDIAYKVLSPIFICLFPHTGKIIGNCRCGFWPGTSSLSQILAVGHILERANEILVD